LKSKQRFVGNVLSLEQSNFKGENGSERCIFFPPLAKARAFTKQPST